MVEAEYHFRKANLSHKYKRWGFTEQFESILGKVNHVTLIPLSIICTL